MKVGIPRAMFYHYFFPWWKTFFTELGCEVVVSPDTTRQMVDKGVTAAVAEACFPVKVFYGHVCYLCEQDIDAVFAPRIVSIEPKMYICPKMMGIPDMIKAQVNALHPVIDLCIDFSKGTETFKKSLNTMANFMNRKPSDLYHAWQKGEKAWGEYNEICLQGHCSLDAMKIWEGDQPGDYNDSDLTIGVLGHSYNLNDSSISLGLFRRLNEMGIRIVTAEMIQQHWINTMAATLPKRMFWTIGKDLVGAALAMDNDDQIDGMIYLSCFGCGLDSMLAKLVELRVSKPYMMLTVDEHSGEAGVITRLEAFSDMLKRRPWREDNFPSYGQSLYTNQIPVAEPGS
ncbi:MAG: acyl-CoA dehydratase activase-related protein [Chitinophagales bacterium]